MIKRTGRRACFPNRTPRCDRELSGVCFSLACRNRFLCVSLSGSSESGACSGMVTQWSALGFSGRRWNIVQIWHIDDHIGSMHSSHSLCSPLQHLRGRQMEERCWLEEANSLSYMYMSLWGSVRGKIVLSCFAERVGVQCVAYAPKRNLAVVGCTDGSIQIVDTMTREHLHTYHGHQALVRSVAWSPDGRYILSGSDDTYIFVWAVPAELFRAIQAPTQ